jgi:glutaredoxin
MKLILLGAALLCGAGAALAGQLYKWTDADGKVHYTDQPPPKEARNAERKQYGDKPPAATLPYTVADAVRKFPVKFYTAAQCGDACKQAAAYLAKRGVPYDTKDASDPKVQEELAKLTGGKLEVPLMTVGTNVVRGYEEGAWQRALDAAGYPSSSMLPPSAAPRPAAAKPGQPGNDS